MICNKVCLALVHCLLDYRHYLSPMDEFVLRQVPHLAAVRSDSRLSGSRSNFHGKLFCHSILAVIDEHPDSRIGLLDPLAQMRFISVAAE